MGQIKQDGASPMTFEKSQTIAVIGAGMAGATCARALQLAGHSVHVFDKSRGPGGRLATRRVEWIDRQGLSNTTRFDHGAIGISARSEAFREFVDRCVHEKRLAMWEPTLAACSLPLDDGDRFYVPVPAMPSLCRHLLDGASVTFSYAVDALHKSPLGWQVEAAGERHPLIFDSVVLALPPAQIAPLLGSHRHDWAEQAAVTNMQSCWTLMGITEDPESVLSWAIARPPTGPLAWVMRNDARPGVERTLGSAQWVIHAQAAWSCQHLEQPAAWVEQQLQAALGDWLRRPVNWLHSVVHRWRYALPPVTSATASDSCWWDASMNLGVCGDFLGGAGIDAVEGVERAWLSAQALCAALLQRAANMGDEDKASTTHETGHDRVA